MTSHRAQTHRQAMANLLLVVLTLLACVAVLTAAAVAPAPHVVQPFIVVVCVGFTAAMAGGAPASLAVVRRSRDAIERLRRQLDELPEAEHPLGF